MLGKQGHLAFRVVLLDCVRLHCTSFSPNHPVLPVPPQVMAQQAAWRESEARRRRRTQERERRRLQAQGVGRAPARDWREVEEEAAEEEEVERAEALQDSVMEDELARRLALDMWPCRYELAQAHRCLWEIGLQGWSWQDGVGSRLCRTLEIAGVCHMNRWK